MNWPGSESYQGRWSNVAFTLASRPIYDMNHPRNVNSPNLSRTILPNATGPFIHTEKSPESLCGFHSRSCHFSQRLFQTADLTQWFGIGENLVKRFFSFKSYAFEYKDDTYNWCPHAKTEWPKTHTLPGGGWRMSLFFASRAFCISCEGTEMEERYHAPLRTFYAETHLLM